MAKDWDLEDIRTLFRKLTGRLTTAILSDDDCNNEINSFYMHDFVQEVQPKELQAVYEFDLTASTGLYEIDEAVIIVNPPVWINNKRVSWHTNYDDFFSNLYPWDYDDEGEPSDILITGRAMYVRPIPDDAYEFKAFALYRPDELTADASVPDDLKWSPMIAYGAAIKYLIAQGESENAAEIQPGYILSKNSIITKQVQQYPCGMRAYPRF